MITIYYCSSQMSEDTFNLEELEKQIRNTTSVIMTPDVENEGKFLMYSDGMRDNYGLPELSVRDVPGMFSRLCGDLIVELNAYRIHYEDNPILVGQTIGWSCGDMIVEKDHEMEDTLLLISRITDIECCVGCDTKAAGIEE